MSTGLLTRPERALWHPRVLVEKYDDDMEAYARRKSGLHVAQPCQGDDLIRAGVKPYATAEDEGNLLTTAGLTRLMTLLIASGGQGLTNTATRLGTGNGAGSAAIGDTDLGAAAGSANRWFQIMDATYPSVATNVMTVKASWATGDGNYAWNEWGIDVGSPTVSSSATVAACFFNHKTSAALGTKVSGIWALTVTVTIS